LVEHAPQSSIELEISHKRCGRSPVFVLAYEENNYSELFKLDWRHGHSEDDRGRRICDPEYTSNEYTVADACMIADGTGYMLKHPFVNGHLQKVLARWAYKLFTSGGIVLPGFALADDGYLIVHKGQVYSGSDWIPRNTAAAALPCSAVLWSGTRSE